MAIAAPILGAVHIRPANAGLSDSPGGCERQTVDPHF
jgi:hypothetical protein